MNRQLGEAQENLLDEDIPEVLICQQCWSVSIGGLCSDEQWVLNKTTKTRGVCTHRFGADQLYCSDWCDSAAGRGDTPKPRPTIVSNYLDLATGKALSDLMAYAGMLWAWKEEREDVEKSSAEYRELFRKISEKDRFERLNRAKKHRYYGEAEKGVPTEDELKVSIEKSYESTQLQGSADRVSASEENVERRRRVTLKPGAASRCIYFHTQSSYFQKILKVIQDHNLTDQKVDPVDVLEMSGKLSDEIRRSMREHFRNLPDDQDRPKKKLKIMIQGLLGPRPQPGREVYRAQNKRVKRVTETILTIAEPSLNLVRKREEVILRSAAEALMRSEESESREEVQSRSEARGEEKKAKRVRLKASVEVNNEIL